MTAAIWIFLFICALGYVLTPLFQEKLVWVGKPDEQDQQRAILDREKKIFLRALKDVEFEHASDKMSQADYDDLRSHYQHKVSEIMAAIDDLESRSQESADDE